MNQRMTAERVFEQTRADLAGENGDVAREAMLEGLMRLQREVFGDLFRVFGKDGVMVRHTPAGLLIARRVP